ncbi:uncharacterized protein LOC106673064 [Cimex lectularius]|uniref:Uncharacterized protein n=1 Tax=Cimex lectularius TaxID=79782 RepID=A0A8I6SJC4_CIMLE|nr:uncharacterized protein LOC106673064 [Cimex lectularius]
MEKELLNEILTLQGNNLTDILRNFGCLLVRKREILKNNLNGVLSLLNSDDNLHKYIMIKLINEFKCHNEVLSVLKSGDRFALKQVLKCTWFFEDLQDSQILMNDILPYLSFCTRMKVISLYSKYLKKTDLIENLFTALHQKYELSLALILLPACSQKFVTDRLPTFKTKVPSSVFQELLNHYPDLAKEYLEFILESVNKQKRAFRYLNFDDYNVLFLNLASSDPKYFMRIYQQYNRHMPYFNLGRRTSKKIIRTDTEAFINNFDKYSKIISLEFTRAYLSIDQMEKLQLALFPKSTTKFFLMGGENNFIEVTRKLKMEIRAEILLKNFSKAFSRPFVYEEFAPALSQHVIAHFPEEVRVKWIEATLPKKESAYDKADLIEYLPTSRSIPLLKKLAENQSELNARIYLFNKIFRTLNFNNDLEKLPSILVYFVTRFRNEEFPMREQVYSSLVEFKRLLFALKIDDWETVNELLKLVKLNKEQTRLQHLITKTQHIQVLSYFKKGFPMETHLKNYFQSQISLFKACNYEICTNSIYEKTCLLFFLTEVSNLTQMDEKSIDNHLNSLAVQICKYNQRNKKDRIEIPEWLVEKVKSSFTRKKEFDWNMYNLMQSCKKDYVFREKLFPKLFPERMDTDILLFILKKSPGLIVQNVDSVLKNFFENALNVDSMKFFSQLRMYSPFELPQKIIHLCINALQNSSEDGDGKDFQYHAKPNAIRILCLMMPSNCFLKMIEPYYPKSLKIEYTDEDDEFYRIQQEIAQSLKLLNDTALAVVPMKKFAGGDYLKYIVGSINSIVLKIPEAEIIPMLKEWLDSPVSVRKHFIRAFLKINKMYAKSDWVFTF